MRTYIAIIVLALVATACAFPQQGSTSPDSIGGTYYVNGTDALGVEYGGQLVITPSDDPDMFEMQWIITGSVQVGEGEWDGYQLEASWETVEGLVQTSGLAMYDLYPDGSLIGERTMDGREGTGYEEAFPVLP